MNVTIKQAEIAGTIKAIASKSQAHRMLICAAFADAPTDIICRELSLDIEATAGCLNAMGACIDYDKEAGVFHVIPRGSSGNTASAERVTIDVGESGSTLRFILPVLCALGLKTHIVMHGRLPERPLSPLWEELEAHGAVLTKNADGTVDVDGRLQGDAFTIAADVSSQFISGLLFAIPLIQGRTADTTLVLTGNIESKNYILMTIDALKIFGIDVDWDGNTMKIRQDAAYRSAEKTEVEGDWSNGAFWICASAMTGGKLAVTGLNMESAQGDREVLKLRDMIVGRSAADSGNVCRIDARNVPDLVPVLSVLAASVSGETVFEHAERLRIKESDRIKTTIELLTKLGAKAEETADGLRVFGTGKLAGGVIDSCNDHRIAMSAAVASIICDGEVTVLNAGAVRKSYPDFWKDFASLGAELEICE